MLKYVNTEVVFAELPDEITLAINISNCPCHCEGCHSSYLARDIGEVLTFSRIEKLIKENKGVSAVCFMGGDSDTKLINHYAKLTKASSSIKVGWYSGRQELSDNIDIKNFDYIKLGPYIKEKGPLNAPTTNQVLYKVVSNELIEMKNPFSL